MTIQLTICSSHNVHAPSHHSHSAHHHWHWAHGNCSSQTFTWRKGMLPKVWPLRSNCTVPCQMLTRVYTLPTGKHSLYAHAITQSPHSHKVPLCPVMIQWSHGNDYFQNHYEHRSLLIQHFDLFQDWGVPYHPGTGHAQITTVKNSLYVKLEKYEFHKPSVKYLSYVLKKGGVVMGQSKVDALTFWPQLKTTKELQCFLGFTNFYRYFFQGFSMVAARLTSLLKGR